MSEHAADHSVLKLFHPAIQNWFSGIGRPTEIQSLSWPRIAEGKHCLISAPTGSGKTLTAFLWSINRFLTGELKTGQTRILYISPLKALNNDIRENLLLPLQQLQAEVEQSGESFPLIRVQTRSGDTDSNARRQMLRQPPDILITTPESLNLLLSSRSGISLLDQLDTVILDELHSLLGNKRGTYLMSAIERLVPLSGEFQRIALSATIEPMSVAARFLGGYRCEDTDSPVPSYISRDVQILQGQGAGQKSYEVNVLYPDRLRQHATDKTLWDYLAEELLDVIARNRSTLIFVNSRALCEKLTLKVNTAAKRVVAYAHHGSLSKELRKEVEQRLKQGELAAIIATSSLEMGIDIGALDEVVLIQTVDAMASAIQRIGRAGHRVGEVSKGLFLPTHAQDFLETAVLAEAVLNKTIEPLKPVQCPLDVLAQVIISCTAIQSWPLTTLYNQLRCCSAYHDLSREQFDLVLNMLAGQYSDNRIRELQRRINVDRIAQTATATKGAVLTLYQAGGVIPDRGYFHLRHQDSSAKIGELDEEFVWETRVGQTFTLGTQNWQIQRITHNDVFVLPGKRGPTPPPFWKAESLNRNVHFSARIGIFLKRINTDLSESKEPLDPLINQLHHRYLQSEYALDLSASRALLTFLVEQRQHTGVELPHQHHIVIEEVHSFLGYQQGRQIVIHTFWGAPLNRPLALALEAAWQKQFGEQIEIFSSNDCLVLQLPHGIAAEQLLHLVAAEQLESLLRQRLEGSGFFGARFRECAGRALLLSKGQFNQRHPLWMSRLQSQKLLDVVRSAADFPILLETWRTCFQDEFDLPGLRTKLEQLDSGAIRWSLCSVNTPSPMAKNIGWDQVNQYMYMDDTPKNQAASSLSDQLLQSLVFDTERRPQIPLDIIAAFNTKRQRLSPGYAPDSPSELLEWVKERLIIPTPEWRALRAAMAQEYGPT
ncbi:MAG: DEAD/DEAH box helicase, partial [Pseudomonadales bacterium]|nr:DEAD/DEAH box helicase [Pseudomonadales bacterium]